MKKNLLKVTMLITLVLTSIFYLSCSKDNNDTVVNATVNETENAFAELNYKLDEYNKTYNFEIETRKGFWKRLLWVVAGDACGAIVGSIAGGGGAIVGGVLNSILCAATGPPAIFSEYKSSNDTSIAFSNINITLVDGEIGRLHNLIIQEILTENPMLLTESIDIKEVSLIIQQKMRKYGYYISYDNNLKLVNKLEQIRPTAFPNSIEESILLYKKASPGYAKEIDVIYNFASNAVQLSDEEALKNYSNGYINIIND